MTTTTIEIGGITHVVKDVNSVQITDKTQDEDGYYVREFRFYGEPIGEGSPPLVVTVRIKSIESSKVDLTAPAQVF